MKKLFIMLAVITFPMAVFAQSIVGSPHDLTDNTNNFYQSGTQQICWFCHVPHNANETRALWNRNDTTTDYTTWSETATINGTILPTGANSIGVGSRKCLSCHDGTVSMGTVAYGISIPGLDWNANAGVMTGNAVVNPGDMSGNHPISIPYPPVTGNTDNQYNGIDSGYTDITAAEQNFKTISAAQSGGIVFYEDSTNAGVYGIECGSCHDPHYYDLASGMRFTHDTLNGSAICLDCHIK